jgi:hypothetical protein
MGCLHAVQVIEAKIVRGTWAAPLMNRFIRVPWPCRGPNELLFLLVGGVLLLLVLRLAFWGAAGSVGSDLPGGVLGVLLSVRPADCVDEEGAVGNGRSLRNAAV